MYIISNLELTQPMFFCQVTKSSHIIIPTSVEVNRTIQSSLYYSPAMFTVKLTVQSDETV